MRTATLMDEARQLGSHGALRVGPRHGRHRDDGPSPQGTALAIEPDPAPASGEGWVAELECGHNQHVRHNPPLITREWVTSPEGRAWGIGKILDCPKCENGSIGFGTSNQRQRTTDPSMQAIAAGEADSPPYSCAGMMSLGVWRRE